MVWTLEDLRTANAMTFAQIEDRWPDANRQGVRGLPWAWLVLAQRLTFLYGEDGALERLNTPMAVAA